MSWLDKLLGKPVQREFGAKSISFEYPGSVSDTIAGYPSFPLFDSYGLMYRKQPAVRTVVDFIAQNIAQLNPKVYDKVGPTDRREWPDHPVAELLHHPNPDTTRYRFLFATVADQCIYDRAYWRKVKKNGLTETLARIPPSRMEVEVDYENLSTIYRFKGKIVPRDSLVVLPGYHPDGGEQGVSPLETLRRVLAEDWAAGIYREYMWRNGARQPMIVERGVDAPEWSPEARDRFLQSFGEAIRNGQGSPPMLEDGMKAVVAAFSPEQSQYIEGRQLTQVEVARVYAPSLVGLMGSSAPRNAVESFHRQLYQDVLGPRLRMIQDEIDLQLLDTDEMDAGGDPYCEFNLTDKLKGSFEEQADVLIRSVGVPYLSINEARARLNLPGLTGPEYAEPIQPLNVLYGGQPSVVNPTADPGNPEPLTAVPMAASRTFALLEFLDRQEESVKSRLGANKEDWWQFNRWDRELAEIVGADIAPLINVNRYEDIKRAGATFDAVEEVFRRAKMEAQQSEVTL